MNDLHLCNPTQFRKLYLLFLEKEHFLLRLESANDAWAQVARPNASAAIRKF